jgi:hypothetical protein
VCYKVKKKLHFERLECWYYSLECFTKYVVEMVSDGMIHIPNFIKTDSCIHVQILRGCNVCITDGKDKNYTVEMARACTTFHEERFRYSSNIKGIPQQSEIP